jgi:hypothetical protein
VKNTLLESAFTYFVLFCNSFNLNSISSLLTQRGNNPASDETYEKRIKTDSLIVICCTNNKMSKANTSLIWVEYLSDCQIRLTFETQKTSLNIKSIGFTLQK